MTESALAVWEFRCNECELESFKSRLRQVFKKWVFQLEESDGGYRHYQGRGSLIKRRRKQELLPVLRSAGLDDLDVRPTITTEHTKEAFYQTKADTRVDGPWKDTDTELYIPRQYRGLMDRLYPFQQKVIDSVFEFDSRAIQLVYCQFGAKGKSTIAALCCLHYGCIRIPAVNDAEKLIASVCDILHAKKERNPRAVFLDLPRAMDKTKLRGIYTAIEEIKCGYVYDLRYTYKDWWFDSPAVWVFTNIEPQMDYLSPDRWKIWTINYVYELVPFVPGS
jgi:hypothetical protein